MALIDVLRDKTYEQKRVHNILKTFTSSFVKTRGNRFYQMVYNVIKIFSRRSGVSYAEVLKRFSHVVDVDLETSLTRSPIVLCTDMKRSCVRIPHLTTYIFNTHGKRPSEVFRDLPKT